MLGLVSVLWHALVLSRQKDVAAQQLQHDTIKVGLVSVMACFSSVHTENVLRHNRCMRIKA